jgi:hypothetical protein
MKNTLAAFKSPLLAQARLLGLNDSNDLEFFHNRDKIQANNPCKNTMSNISTLPRFNSSQTESERTDFGLPVAELVKFFERKAKSTYERMLISARGQEILSKALKYHIPFNNQNIDWLSLMDEVNEYEDLMEKCNDLRVDWDFDFYDPVGLEQEISFYEQKESAFDRDLYYDFDRGVA